jgi:hypothetical protein
MNLKIYINDKYYKTVTVAENDKGGYDAKPISMQLMAERDAGMLNDFGVRNSMNLRFVPEED